MVNSVSESNAHRQETRNGHPHVPDSISDAQRSLISILLERARTSGREITVRINHLNEPKPQVIQIGSEEGLSRALDGKKYEVRQMILRRLVDAAEKEVLAAANVSV